MQQSRTSLWRVNVASLVGSTIEWYDYFLYGTAAALVFNKLYFPGFSPTAGTLAAFATFAVGFIARPVGAIFFGHFGDRVGRKRTLVATLLIAGLGTFAIGLLPTYDTLGVLAPILLVVLRVTQGFGLGGEWAGSVLLSVEHAPSGRRGFYGSLPQAGVPVGLLLGTTAFAVAGVLPEEQFLSWGWRVPFLLSISMVGVGLFIRLKVTESPAFAEVKGSSDTPRIPIALVLRTNLKGIVIAAGTRLGTDVVFYTVSVFSLTYLTDHLGMSNAVGLTAVIIAAGLGMFTVPAFGALSDRLGRRPVLIAGALFMAAWTFPFFALLDTKSPVLVTVAIVVAMNVGWPATYATSGAFCAELFETRVRYSGASLGFQLSGILGGSLAPLISVALLASSGGSPWSIAVYVAAMCLVSLVAVGLAKETSRIDLAERPREHLHS